MKDSLISRDLLLKSDRILFIIPLAIGDFVYLHNYFKKLADMYPHLKIDLWIDEVRRTFCFWRWKGLKRYSLYDWVHSCSFFNKIYDETYSPLVLKKTLLKAKKENYSIVVSWSSKRKHVKFAKLISSNGVLIGMSKKEGFFRFIDKYYYNKLNFAVNYNAFKKEHIIHTNHSLFRKIFGLNLEEKDLYPSINIPKEWILQAKLKFLKWGINKNHSKVIFINTFAKPKKRNWTLEKLMKLIIELRKDDNFYNTAFVINAPPDQFERVKNVLNNYSFNQNFLFTANKSFFQLPAIISLCDLVISVETSVIHLASVLKIPVVALMRQKNPEWAPYGVKQQIILTKKREDWISHIEADKVIMVAKSFFQQVVNN